MAFEDRSESDFNPGHASSLLKFTDSITSLKSIIPVDLYFVKFELDRLRILYPY